MLFLAVTYESIRAHTKKIRSVCDEILHERIDQRRDSIF